MPVRRRASLARERDANGKSLPEEPVAKLRPQEFCNCL
jgi:hypothetical protein